jgi:hypothetical protein
MASVGRIELDGRPYNIALEPDSYKVAEIPTHSDVDQKMERRVIWRDFSIGINRRREDPSLDATSVTSKSYTYFRQVRNPQGFYWAAGCDTTRMDRIFAQRATTSSNMNVAGHKFTHFIDGSLVSLAFSQFAVYTLAPPGTWTLSATLSTAGQISDGIQYGGQIYIALSPYNGTATGVTATTLTDSGAHWLTNQFTGATLTMGASTATVTSNTGTVLTFTGGWTGGTPALSTYQVALGMYTWSQLSGAAWTQRSVAASHFTVIREQLWRSLNANIYDTINTDPTSQVWSGATVIGDPNTPITGLDVFQDFLMIFKQDGVYSADKNGNVYPIFPGFKTLGTNPRPIGQWQDEYYFAADVGLIWAYSPKGGVRRVGFDWSEPYPMDPVDTDTAQKIFSIPNVADAAQGIPLTNFLVVPFNQFVTQGYSSGVTATTMTDSSASWIVNAYVGDTVSITNNNGATSTATITSNTATVLTFSGGWVGGTPPSGFYKILDQHAAAFYFAYDGTGWHPFRYFANSQAIGVGITGGNLVPSNPTLHFCVIPNGSNTQIQYMIQPLIDPFVAANFDTSIQTIYFPADNGALEDEYKVFERVNVFIDNPEAGSIRLYYAIDEEIPTLTFHDMGAPQFQGLQGNQVFVPPLPLPQYVKIMLKMTITPTASTASPAVRNVVLHYKQRSPQRRTWDIAILGDEFLVGSTGRIDTRNSKKIIDDLNKARITHQQVHFVDALLNKANVYVDEVGETIKILKGARNPSYIITVKLVENIDQTRI